MRIPPAVAKEIGAYYASARANDAVALQLTETAQLLAAAVERTAQQDLASALVDARKAVALLTAVPTASIAPAAAEQVSFALSTATAGIRWLDRPAPNAAGAVNVLRFASHRAGEAATITQDRAAELRIAARELASQYA